MRVYICGVEDFTGLERAVRWGASAVGIKIGYGEERVHPEKARELFAGLPLFISRVGMFTDEKRYQIEELVTFCRLDAVHFTGSEQPAELERYGEQLIKTFSIEEINSAGGYPIQAVSFPVDEKTLAEPFLIPQDKKVILAGRLTLDGWQRAAEIFMPYAAQVEISETTPELVRSLLVL